MSRRVSALSPVHVLPLAGALLLSTFARADEREDDEDDRLAETASGLVIDPPVSVALTAT